MNEKKLIALDLGGVCVEIHPEHLLTGLQSFLAANPEFSPAIPDGLIPMLKKTYQGLSTNSGAYHAHNAAPANLPAADPLELCGRLERGEIGEDDFFDSLNRFTGRAFPLPVLKELWNSQIGETVSGTYEQVEQWLGAGYRVVFFSNTSAVHLEVVRKNCRICDLVADGVYSFEIGALKPEEAAYAAFEERFGVPDWFFDDRGENVEAASRRGWRSVRFFGPDSLAGLL